LGLVQGVFLGVILVVESRYQKSKLLLGLFIIIFSAELLNSILEDLKILEITPELLFIPFNFNYLVIPLFYLYVKNVSNSIVSKKRLFLILLPGILEFLFYSILFLQKNDFKMRLFNSETFMEWLGLLTILSLPYSIYYGVLTIKYINKHKESVEGFYSNTEGKLLLWAKGVTLFLLLFISFMFSSLFIDNDFYTVYIYPIMSTINVMFIFWIGISGIRQVKLFDSQNLSTKNITMGLNKSAFVKTELIDKQYSRLTELMDKEKFFLVPNISLADLSRKLEMPQRSLSELIRENSKKNFNQFINHYRVEEAKKLLSDSSNNNLNMLGIAYDSGFNSKASFYSVFKKTTSLTPTEFKNRKL